jgi:hypothetical protein
MYNRGELFAAVIFFLPAQILKNRYNKISNHIYFMKKVALLFSLTASLVILAACGSGTAEADKAAEAEVKKMDSVNTVLDESKKTIQEKSADLESSLQELEAETKK